MRIYNLLIVFSLVAWVISACSPAPAPTPTPTFTPEPTRTNPPPPTVEPTATLAPEPTVVPEFSSGLPNTFENEGNYLFDYPEDWFVASDHSSVVYLTTYDIRTQIGQDGLPEGATKLDFIIVGDYDTLEIFLNAPEIANGRSELGNIVEERIILPDGSPALLTRAQSNFGPVIALYAVLANNRGVVVAGYGNFDPFETIALTLRSP